MVGLETFLWMGIPTKKEGALKSKSLSELNGPSMVNSTGQMNPIFLMNPNKDPNLVAIFASFGLVCREGWAVYRSMQQVLDYGPYI